MDYFGKDGPTPMQPNQPSDEEMKAAMAKAQQSKDRYLKFFMIDFVEMSMRKVANQNTVFCAKQAKLFDNLMEEDLTVREKKRQLQRFENCLGKHTDSLEHALSMLSTHI